MRAYAASTKVSDTVFDVINKVPDQAKTEVGTPARPAKATDEEWAKIQKESQELAKDSHDLRRVGVFPAPAARYRSGETGSGARRLPQGLPDAEKDNAAQVNHAYFQAYRMQGQSGQDGGVRRQGDCR